MNKKNFVRLIQVAAVVVIVIGFRLAAQTGQGLNVVQNDGYAGSGGALILLGGLVLGVTLKYLTTIKKRK